jgi:hypothetical protein
MIGFAQATLPARHGRGAGRAQREGPEGRVAFGDAAGPTRKGEELGVMTMDVVDVPVHE